MYPLSFNPILYPIEMYLHEVIQVYRKRVAIRPYWRIRNVMVGAPKARIYHNIWLIEAFLLQLTLAIFTGLFGRSARKISIELWEAGLVHIVATNAHGVGARLGADAKSLDWLGNEYGIDVLRNLPHGNPLYILQIREVDLAQISRSCGL